MARTTPMRLVELMILKQDISSVLEFLGKKGNFQFQDKKNSGISSSDGKKSDLKNPDAEILESLKSARNFLGIKDIDSSYLEKFSRPTDEDRNSASKFIGDVNDFMKRENAAAQEKERVQSAYDEAKSFANLKVNFSELDHLSFLSLRVGKIDQKNFDELKFAVGERAVVIPLGDNKSKILAASSKKARFSLDSELKNFGFVPLEIPEQFKGVPDGVLEGLKKQIDETEKLYKSLEEEKRNMALTHTEILQSLLAKFSIGAKITDVQNSLESTSLVYRITGWIPESYSHDMMKELDKLTEGRTAIKIYQPREVPAVINGTEQVPVRLKHGKLIGAFERMIFSYGSPVYGAIDPTPFVALFFTVLFGIMFGDAGQGLVFLLLGILMAVKVVKVGGWNKFAPIFIAIGCSSMIMGLLNGEFFGNETLLAPFGRFVTGIFGEPRDRILHLMPDGGMASVVRMFVFFGFTVGVGFVINSIGLIINIADNFLLGKPGKAIFGKNGISGSVFFWYVVVMAIRIAAFGHKISALDWSVIGITLFLTGFCGPLNKLISGERPVLENGLFAAIIESVVEVLETLISYLSNSISFVRVGAFGLAHAVLGFIILTLSKMAGPAYLAVMVAGNAIVIVLEGMIVAIQVIRLQYYEFFSKFFNETGREFAPFCFEYK
ncbi:MAG: V-type ATPase 116kDa subunit family protein [Treponema sp.]|nr:V-type ATPase 116kDa subunit family protein [Treponema sp.]